MGFSTPLSTEDENDGGFDARGGSGEEEEDDNEVVMKPDALILFLATLILLLATLILFLATLTLTVIGGGVGGYHVRCLES